MPRQAALDRAAYYDSGAFVADLAQLVAFRTESQEAGGVPFPAACLTEHLRPKLEQTGFVVEGLVNPAPGGHLLLAGRLEHPDLPTVLIYGHGHVIRGLDEVWQDPLLPWQLTERDGRIYGRGVADNKSADHDGAVLGPRSERPKLMRVRGNRSRSARIDVS